MDLLLYRDSKGYISHAEIIKEYTLSIDHPNELLSELLSFDWIIFAYNYEGILSCGGNINSRISNILFSQISSFSPYCQRFLSEVLFNQFEYPDFYLFPDQEMSKHALLSSIPFCQELCNEINNVASLISTIHLTIKHRYDFDQLQYILHFAYNYNLISYPFFPEKTSIQQCFDIIRSIISPWKDLSYNQYTSTVGQLLRSTNNQEIITHTQALINLISCHDHSYKREIADLLFDYHSWLLTAGHKMDTNSCLSSFVSIFNNAISYSANKSFKAIVAEHIYRILHTPPYPSIPELFHCNSFSDFLCSLTLSYYKQQTPLSTCQYCNNIFVRTTNSQKMCFRESCRKIAKNSGKSNSLELFGRDLYNILNNVYKRLCYSGTGANSKYDESKYINCGISDAASKVIVIQFSKLKKEYVNELNNHITTIWGLPEHSRKDYICFVNNWINQIDSYYTKQTISNRIVEVIHDDKYPKGKKNLTIKHFTFNPSYQMGIAVTNINIPIIE